MTTADDVFDAVMGYAAKEYQRGYENGKRDAARDDNPPKLTCVMVPKVLSDDGIITHVTFNCSACGKGRNFPTYVDFTDRIGTAEDVIRTHRIVGYCEDCGAEVVQ